MLFGLKFCDLSFQLHQDSPSFLLLYSLIRSNRWGGMIDKRDGFLFISFCIVLSRKMANNTLKVHKL